MVNIDKKDLSILYVEDDKDTREELILFLKQKCKNVHVATNGEEGLQIYKNFSPTLIISDIQMPKMSGIDMALEIRRQNEYVPIIFLTAFNEVDYLKKSISLGALDYSIKPVDLKNLSEKIDEVLNPEKVYVFSCILDKECKVVETKGSLSKIFDNPQDIIGKNFERYIVKPQVEKYKNLMQLLRNNEKFYRELLSIKGDNGDVVELIVDGKKLDNGHYELALTIMRYFLRSYEQIERILIKEKTLNKMLEYKNAIFELMQNAKTSSDFLDTICDSIVHFNNYDLAMVYSFDEKKEYFELTSFSSSSNISHDDLICKFFLEETQECFVEEVAKKNPIMVLEKKFNNYPFFNENSFNKLPKNLIIVPLYLDKKFPLSGIVVIMGNREFFINAYDFGMIRDLGRTIALGVERIDNKRKLKDLLLKANRQSRTDALTGAYNRLMFDEILEKSIYQSERYNSPLSILYLDLDLFKSINDRFGHKEGDKVLVRFVKMISSIIRNSDLFARIGGEEFGLILPNTDLKKAKEVGNKILDILRKRSLLTNGDILTTSIGIATYDLNQKKGSDHLLEQADAKLYEAKHTGRNKLCF